MVWRVLRFLAGAGVAGGGGYLVWMHRGEAPALYPFAIETAPWWLIAGLVMLVLGMVSVVSALLPSASAGQRAEKIARHEAHLKDADTFYAQRARAVERDWRDGDLPPEPEPRTPVAPEPLAMVSPAQPEVAAISPSAALPIEPPAAVEQPPAPARAHAAALSSAARPASGAQMFPAAVTLAAIPHAGSLLAEAPPPHLQRMAAAPSRANEPESAVQAAQTPPAAAAQANHAAAEAAPAATPASPLEAIRTAIAASRLEEADRMLASERLRLSADDADPLALAELTGLAGDHAAAAGRLGGAKWLWRLSLQRFASANAIGTPAARNVSERLRRADQ